MNPEMQKQIAEFVERHELNTGITYRLLDLVSEIGEVSKELLKATEYGQSEFRPGETHEKWEEELGDVLFSLICVANATGVDLEQALMKVLTKYRKRLESKGDAGSGR